MRRRPLDLVAARPGAGLAAARLAAASAMPDERPGAVETTAGRRPATTSPASPSTRRRRRRATSAARDRHGVPRRDDGARRSRPRVAKQFLAKDAPGVVEPRAPDDHLLRRLAAAGRQRSDGRRSRSATRTTLDSRGAWRGRLPAVRATVLRFPMTVENGEWRIAAAPERADRAGDVVRAAVPRGLALLLRPDRPDPGPRAGVRARAASSRHRAGRGAAARPAGRPGAGVARSFIPPGSTRRLGAGLAERGRATIALKGDVGPQTPQAIAADARPVRLDPAPGPVDPSGSDHHRRPARSSCRAG